MNRKSESAPTPKSVWDTETLWILILIIATLAIAFWVTPAKGAYLPDEKLVTYMETLITEQAEDADFFSKLYLFAQSGETYRNQPVAYFVVTSDKEVFWQLEEFEPLPNGLTKVTTWKFERNKASRWHAVVDTSDGRPFRVISGGILENREWLDIASPEVIAKSEQTQNLLRLAGKRTEM